jgi:hypothetical protein
VAKLNGKQIEALARQIVFQNPGGIKFGVLKQRIWDAHPETRIKMIQATVWNLHIKFPKEILKPSRGLFVPVDGQDTVAAADQKVVKCQQSAVYESDFYEPFAEWLRDDLGEVTYAAALGGSAMGKKWGTPDVIGVYKPLASDLIKFPLEIVSAEIKIDPQQPVVAFGQAIAYRLFSAKTYIAMPKTIDLNDLSRLEALCMLFGVGLVLFEVFPKQPDFTIRVRAQRFSPDMFYVNEFAERLKDSDAAQFEDLFR